MSDKDFEEFVTEQSFLMLKWLEQRPENVCALRGNHDEAFALSKAGYSSLEEFYLQAREEAYLLGGKPHGMVVAGHILTLIPGEFPYNEGRVLSSMVTTVYIEKRVMSYSLCSLTKIFRFGFLL